MNSLFIKKIAATLTVAIAFGFGAVSQAQTFFEDFEGGTPLPATTFFTHDSISTINQVDTLIPEGLPTLGAFAGAGGGSGNPGGAVGSMVSTSAVLGLSANGGVGGSQATLLSLTNNGNNDFVFAGIVQPVGFALTVPTNFIASADVLAPVGYPLTLRVESPFGPTNNGFSLSFVGTGAFQTISGVIGTDLAPIAGGTFDNTTESILLVATDFSGVPVGTNQEIFIDNLSVAPANVVPEPSSFLVPICLGSIIAVRRRRA